MKRVVIGLSGGVDSSVAAYLLKQQGYDVVGLFMINWHDTTGTLEGDCPWHDDRLFAELVARRLDIPLHITDLSAEYRRRVVDYMFAEYERGRTPNPDVLCNREIKFDVFMKEAFRLGADYVATGHYCRKAEELRPDGGTTWRLLAGSDPGKDQSYFLCQLSQEQLRPALFPVGGLLKSEVRRIAAEQGLATAKRKDSQGICFVGKVDLPLFLQQKLAARRGNVHEILATWPKYAQRPPLPEPGCEPTTAQLAALAEPWHYTVRDGKKIGDIDASIVTDHMMLMAASLGLDTLWVCMFKPDAVREEFALPPHVEPVNILFIGYGAGEPASPERHDQTRKPLCETVFHETYGAK